MTAATQSVVCPKCQGATWDQLSSKFWGNGLTKNGKQKPRWECKNKECGGSVWDKSLNSQPATPPKSAPSKPPSFANKPESEIPAFLRDAGEEDAAELQQKIGFDIATIQRELALYKALSEFVVREISPIYEAGKVGMSPESAAASVQTLFINITGGKK